MAYELKLKGMIVDSIQNLAVGNYQPDIRYSPSGHITLLSNEDAALFKQSAPLNFLRVHWSGLIDSNICIAKVIDVVDENYEQVTGVVSESCVSDSLANGLQNLNWQNSIKVIPNPSAGLFSCYFSGSLAGADIRVFDALGQVVYQNIDYQGLSNGFQLDLSHFGGGLYFLQINVKGKVITKRLVLLKQ
jgi:hypothetical protein